MDQYLVLSGSASLMNDKQLTAAIKNATTPERLAQLADAHTGALNPIHIAAILTKLANISKKTPTQLQTSSTARPGNMYMLRSMQTRQQLLQQLKHTLKAQRCQGHCPRGLANIIWALAKLQAAPDAELLSMLLQGFCQQLPVAVPQDIANVLWGVAQLTRDYGISTITSRHCSSMDGPSSEPGSPIAAARSTGLATAAVAVAREADGMEDVSSLAAIQEEPAQQQVGQEQQTGETAGAVSGNQPAAETAASTSRAQPQQQLLLQLPLADGKPLLSEVQVHQLLQQLCTMLPLAASQTISNIAWAVTVLQQCHDWCLCCCMPQMQQLLSAFVSHLHDAQPGHVQRVVRCITQLSTACSSHAGQAWVEWQPPALQVLLKHMLQQRKILKQYHVASVLKDVTHIGFLFLPSGSAAAEAGAAAACNSTATAAAGAAAEAVAAVVDDATSESEDEESDDLQPLSPTSSLVHDVVQQMFNRLVIADAADGELPFQQQEEQAAEPISPESKCVRELVAEVFQRVLSGINEQGTAAAAEPASSSSSGSKLSAAPLASTSAAVLARVLPQLHRLGLLEQYTVLRGLFPQGSLPAATPGSQSSVVHFEQQPHYQQHYHNHSQQQHGPGRPYMGPLALQQGLFRPPPPPPQPPPPPMQQQFGHMGLRQQPLPGGPGSRLGPAAGIPSLPLQQQQLPHQQHMRSPGGVQQQSGPRLMQHGMGYHQQQGSNNHIGSLHGSGHRRLPGSGSGAGVNPSRPGPGSGLQDYHAARSMPDGASFTHMLQQQRLDGRAGLGKATSTPLQQQQQGNLHVPPPPPPMRGTNGSSDPQQQQHGRPELQQQQQQQQPRGLNVDSLQVPQLQQRGAPAGAGAGSSSSLHVVASPTLLHAPAEPSRATATVAAGSSSDGGGLLQSPFESATSTATVALDSVSTPVGSGPVVSTSTTSNSAAMEGPSSSSLSSGSSSQPLLAERAHGSISSSSLLPTLKPNTSIHSQGFGDSLQLSPRGLPSNQSGPSMFEQPLGGSSAGSSHAMHQPEQQHSVPGLHHQLQQQQWKQGSSGRQGQATGLCVVPHNQNAQRSSLMPLPPFRHATSSVQQQQRRQQHITGTLVQQPNAVSHTAVQTAQAAPGFGASHQRLELQSSTGLGDSHTGGGEQLPSGAMPGHHAADTQLQAVKAVGQGMGLLGAAALSGGMLSGHMVQQHQLQLRQQSTGEGGLGGTPVATSSGTASLQGTNAAPWVASNSLNSHHHQQQQQQQYQQQQQQQQASTGNTPIVYVQQGGQSLAYHSMPDGTLVPVRGQVHQEHQRIQPPSQQQPHTQQQVLFVEQAPHASAPLQLTFSQDQPAISGMLPVGGATAGAYSSLHQHLQPQPQQQYMVAASETPTTPGLHVAGGGAASLSTAVYHDASGALYAVQPQQQMQVLPSQLMQNAAQQQQHDGYSTAVPHGQGLMLTGSVPYQGSSAGTSFLQQVQVAVPMQPQQQQQQTIYVNSSNASGGLSMYAAGDAAAAAPVLGQPMQQQQIPGGSIVTPVGPTSGASGLGSAGVQFVQMLSGSEYLTTASGPASASGQIGVVLDMNSAAAASPQLLDLHHQQQQPQQHVYYTLPPGYH